MDEQKPVPIIRMVFALAAEDSHVRAVESVPLRKSLPRAAKPKAEKKWARRRPAYTAYNIWCAGSSAGTFSVIEPGDEQVYAELLKVSPMFPNVYEAHTNIDLAKSARRNMNPGTAAHPDHWSQLARFGKEIERADLVEVDFDCKEAADDDIEMG
jgi:hypothetical protein